MSDARSPVQTALAALMGLSVILGAVTGLQAADIRPAQAAISTFTVDSADDESDEGPGDGLCLTEFGTCTLRAAIEEGNDLGGPIIIDFAIGTGAQTIVPSSPLPAMADEFVIDGTTQPGFAGSPLIELNGMNAGVGADGLVIGAGGTTVKGLVINRFSGDGIVISTNGGNTITGNFIGTNAAGTADLGNGVNGVFIGGAPSNTIGGTAPGTRNLISGNNFVGIYIDSPSATGNTVQGNYIGTDVTGTVDLGNTSDGVVMVNAPSNTIGGTAPGAGNVISGNNFIGVEIFDSGSSGNIVQGNYIGTDATGTADLGNTQNGVLINEGTSNIIGGSVAGARNVISGNNANGVAIVVSSGNTVQGNYIGTNAAGTADLGNSFDGVQGSGSNTVGGTAPGAGNVISGNDSDGIDVGTGTLVQGNYIGTDATGTADLGNGGDGVRLVGSSITVGGTASGARNVISGNSLHGIEVLSGTLNRVEGNYIGTDASGTANLGNGGDGVRISSSSTTVGGTVSDARNVIAGNGLHGIELISGAGHKVEGNYIGTDAGGTAAMGNGGDGVRISSSSATVGGTASGAGNTIAFNSGGGVLVSLATGNAIRRNSILSNGALGIDLGVNGVTPNDAGDGDVGANNLQNFPVLTSVVSGGGITTIEGTLNSTANTSFNLDFFSNTACDPSGFGEGRAFLGSADVTTDGGGNAAFSKNFPVTVGAGEPVTAMATDPSGNTSEFSACYPAPSSTFVVDSTGDGPDSNTADGLCDDGTGFCTLRAALQQANAHFPKDIIDFAIDSGLQTIAPASVLPTITNPVVIDGTSQPGFSGSPLIELNGASAGGTSDGLRITAGDSTVRGLLINRFGGDGIELATRGGNAVEGSYIGTDASGAADLGNAQAGVHVNNTPANTIGGGATGTRNVISGNDGVGVDLLGTGASGNLVRGNYIGTNAAGTADLGNASDGVAVNGPGNTIGGATAAARNVISGNNVRGVAIFGAGATGNTVRNNFIGTNAAGTGALGNGTHGISISISSSSNTIGGSRANTIAHNGADGVAVLSGTGNAIRRNSIFSNSGLGIDLGPDGVTPNDEGDEDSGANGLQNFPLVVGASTDPDATQVSGALSSAPDTAYRIDVFRSATCDPSGHGEGERLVGTFNVTTDENGDLIFTRSFPGSTAVGQRMTATATDPGGNTSEFSPCAPVRGPQPDFNGDGFSDLVVGAPEEDLGSAPDAGVIHVIPGSGANLTSIGNQLWHQDSGAVADAAEAGDRFGAASAGGDFNNDGFTDLAVGIPGEDVGAATDAGAVAVLYGSASGLSDASNQLWHQDSGTVTDTAEAGDAFGSALASADLNRDGYLDLAVGVPGEDVSAITDLGAVAVLYGSPTGLTDSGNQLWRQGAQTILGFAEAGDAFGSALTAGDFDSDGYPDLAVGVPGEDLGPPANTIDLGAVNAIYGSPAGLTGEGNQFWRQGDRGIQGLPESGDAFGSALASGDFDADGFADLAVGVPGEDLGAAPDAGAANTIYGSPTGLTGQGNQFWHQDAGTLADASEQADAFGASLAGGDFNDDGIFDLAVGVPGEDLALTDEGAAHAIYGSPVALSDGGNQLWHQGSPNIQDSPEAGDALGSALATGDYDGEGSSDLVLGVPGEDVGATADAGAANALYGSATGLTDLANQLWHQDSSGILETAEAGDRFGAALG